MALPLVVAAAVATGNNTLPTLQHCAISTCDTNPHECMTNLNAGQTMSLFGILFVPIVIAILAPQFARTENSGRDDDMDSGIKYDAVDPPMYLCGVGLLPFDCGISGLLTVCISMGFAVVVVFFSFLASPQPCNTALGQCRTISCACGNVLSQGYTFMLCLLVLTSSMLVQRISRMQQHHRRQHRIIKPTLICGSLLLSLTGIFPEKYDQNGQMSGFYTTFYGLHLLGVFGSGMLLLFVPYIWFVEHWWTRKKDEEIKVRALLARSAYVVATSGFAMGFVVFTAVVKDEVLPYCAGIPNQTHCEKWPMLTPQKCDEARACIAGSNSSLELCEGGGPILQPNFKCAWLPHGQLSQWTQLLAPQTYVQASSCVRSECPLKQYARGVALEFAVLFLTLCYVSSFALHDVRRLLNRPPKEVSQSPFLQPINAPAESDDRPRLLASNAPESDDQPPLLASDAPASDDHSTLLASNAPASDDHSTLLASDAPASDDHSPIPASNALQVDVQTSQDPP